MRKLILKSGLSPGDIVTMTAAVRDLHAAFPKQFLTDVRTPCPALWENNPNITPIPDQEGEPIECHYPLIHGCNQKPYHFIHGYRMDLAERLGIQIPAGAFRGDIHLSDQERGWMSQVEELGHTGPFWIICAGGKRDYTAKIWAPERWQAVVDALRGKVQFVQVGEQGHAHPTLNGVIDLRGKTDLRQLVRLVYHAAGVACGVTSLMHLAAAVPTKDGGLRPCVVVAGGREPAHWEQYPGHRYLDTVGSLDCCRTGGCWKSRVVPLGDGSKHDQSLCVHPVESGNQTIPRCLDLIAAEDVVRAIESYMPPEKPKTAPRRSPCGSPCRGAGKTLRNAISAAGRAIGALVKGDELLVPEEERKSRLNICVACEHYEGPTGKTMPRCRECGCFVKLKTRLATEWCPVGKWGKEPKAGLVIGTYGAVPYIHLQLESLKRFHPGTPCLVVDDGSPQRAELEALCGAYGAEFIGLGERHGHVPGDMSVFIEGHKWAEAKGIGLLIKFSRRFIPMSKWLDSAISLYNQGATTISNKCSFHGFGFRSECVGMDVRAWKESGALGAIQNARERSKSGFVLAESEVHRAAGMAWGLAKMKIDHQKGCGGYAPWKWMGESKRVNMGAFLWHEFCGAGDYAESANGFGIRYSGKSWGVDECAPVIAIAIPSFGRPQRTRRALECLMAQDFPCEKLLIGDGCPDAARVAQDFPSIKFINLPHEGDYGTHCIQWAFDNCDAPFICFMGNDDIVLPSHARSRLLSILATDQDMVFHDATVDISGQPRSRKAMMKYGHIGNSEVVYRTSFVRGSGAKYGGGYGHDFRFLEDLIARGAKFSYSNNPPTYIVKGAGGVTKDIID